MTLQKTLHDRFIQTVFSDDVGRKKRLLLLPLTVASYVYRSALSVRYHCYQSGIIAAQKLSIPVISVGNISVGGTGKTPTTIFLAKSFQKQGKRVAVLSRGYKGSASGPVNVVSDGSHILLSAREAGDEPYLLANRLPGIPVLTGTNRALAGENAQKEFSAQVVVLDDGFQHLRLTRDVDIVLFDYERPFGNGHLLPRGSLRESPRSLRRAHIALVVLPHNEIQESKIKTERLIRSYQPDIPIFYAHYTPADLTTVSGDEATSCGVLKGKQVVALAGVGRPASFVTLLKRLGAEVVETRFFPDHHTYQPKDLDCDHRDALIVTTEKDAVKLKSLKLIDKTILVLPITLTLDQEALFFASLKKCLPSFG